MRATAAIPDSHQDVEHLRRSTRQSGRGEWATSDAHTGEGRHESCTCAVQSSEALAGNLATLDSPVPATQGEEGSTAGQAQEQTAMTRPHDSAADEAAQQEKPQPQTLQDRRLSAAKKRRRDSPDDLDDEANARPGADEMSRSATPLRPGEGHQLCADQDIMLAPSAIPTRAS